MCEIIVPVMPSFYRHKLLWNDIGAYINVLRKIVLFSVYSSYPCFSGALIFPKNQKGFFWVVFAEVTTILSCAPRHVVLQKELSIHQIFHLLNKKIQNKFQDIFLSTSWITLENFIRQNRPIDIAPEHCFDF